MLSIKTQFICSCGFIQLQKVRNFLLNTANPEKNPKQYHDRLLWQLWVVSFCIRRHGCFPHIRRGIIPSVEKDWQLPLLRRLWAEWVPTAPWALWVKLVGVLTKPFRQVLPSCKTTRKCGGWGACIMPLLQLCGKPWWGYYGSCECVYTWAMEIGEEIRNTTTLP